MVPQNQSDQHDTVVLHTPVPAPAPSAPSGLSSPTGSPTGLTAPTGPTGWQGVAQWRDSMAQQAPTAWSQVPPFIPAPVASARPVLVMRNNAAVVGATLGSVALFLSLLPVIGIVAWLIAPIGLLTSTAGLFVGMARRVGRVGALWGMATSGLALAICLAWTALLLAL